MSPCATACAPDDADHLIPLRVHLDEAIERIGQAEQPDARGVAEHADRRGARRFLGREEAPRGDLQRGDLLVVRLDAVDDRQFALRLRNHLRRRKAFARRQHLESGHRRLHGADVLEREAGRLLPHLLEGLELGRLARFDDQIAHAEIFDERHHLLLRAGADRQHRDDRGHAEDHAEHRQQRAELVQQEVVHAASRDRAATARISSRGPLRSARLRLLGVHRTARSG